MHEPLITVIGHVAGPPRQRTTPGGVTVADFRIAATPRRQDKGAGTWGDGETLWFGVTVWRALGEHCAASLKKGDRVVVSGRLTTRSWEAEGGERRSNLEVEASSVGLELSRGNASYVRTPQLVPDADPWTSSGRVDPPDADPWVSSGRVDPQTGEVFMEDSRLQGAVADDAHPEELDHGRPDHVAA